MAYGRYAAIPITVTSTTKTNRRRSSAYVNAVIKMTPMYPYSAGNVRMRET